MAVTERVNALVALYQLIAATRMQGMPLEHPSLSVAAVGFQAEPADERDVPAALGVLLTPLSMDLVWLPLARLQRPEQFGQSTTHRVAGHGMVFVGMHDEHLGSYGACSLFSPVLGFADQHAALTTAHCVLHMLRPVHMRNSTRNTPAATRHQRAGADLTRRPSPAR